MLILKWTASGAEIFAEWGLRKIISMCYYQIDAPRQFAETPIISLTCVDALSSRHLIPVVTTVSLVLQPHFLEVRRFVLCNSL